MSEMFDLDGDSQAPDDDIGLCLETMSFPCSLGERLGSPSMATMTATELSSDKDDGLFGGADSESEPEIEEEDSDVGDSGDESTDEDRMPQWKIDHPSRDHKLQDMSGCRRQNETRILTTSSDELY